MQQRGKEDVPMVFLVFLIKCVVFTCEADRPKGTEFTGPLAHSPHATMGWTELRTPGRDTATQPIITCCLAIAHQKEAGI